MDLCFLSTPEHALRLFICTNQTVFFINFYRATFLSTKLIATSAPTESEEPARRHHREQERPAARLQGVLPPGEGGQVERHVEPLGIVGCLRVEWIGEGDIANCI